MAIEFTSKRNDTSDDIQVQLKHGNGAVVDLTGLVTADINFHIKDTADGTVNTVNANTIDDAVAGKCTLDTSALVATAGVFEIEVEVTFVGGLTKSFPLQDKFIWTILPDLA